MKNSDMPAMPLPAADLGLGGDDLGLTKLEHFAAQAIPPMDMIIEAMKEHTSPFTLNDYIICAASYRIKEASETLRQLEQSNDKS